nr:hypothetical protein Iba_scaffold2842CG0010 [Ipomoea batatas]
MPNGKGQPLPMSSTADPQTHSSAIAAAWRTLEEECCSRHRCSRRKLRRSPGLLAGRGRATERSCPPKSSATVVVFVLDAEQEKREKMMMRQAFTDPPTPPHSTARSVENRGGETSRNCLRHRRDGKEDEDAGWPFLLALPVAVAAVAAHQRRERIAGL